MDKMKSKKRIFGSKMKHKKSEDREKKRIFLAKLICSKFVIQKSAFGLKTKTKKKNSQTFYLYFDVLEKV